MEGYKTKISALSNFIETWKVSFRFAFRNYLSFFLAILGVLVITAVLFFTIIAVYSIPYILSVGPLDDFFDIFDLFGEAFDGAVDIGGIGVGLFLAGSILAPFLIAFGALFGMAQEIIESGGTVAEGVFVWYKRKFVRLAAGGIFQFVVIITPFVLAYIVGTIQYQGAEPTNAVWATYISFAYMWIAIIAGVFSMVFPAIVDGLPILSAIKRSASMSIRYLPTVFSVWVVILGMGTILLVPMILQGIFGIVLIAEAFFELYIILGLLVLVFLVSPIAVLATSRTYIILSSFYEDVEDIDEVEEMEDVSS
ncbi:MAG: hypothetical protein ACW98Y_21505 [Candidatus Thorarchaeota archaeon]